MAVLVGTFGTRAQADDAIERLKALGFAEADLALVSKAEDAVGAPKDEEQRAHDAVDVSVVGAVLGAVLGGALLGPVGAVIGGTAAGGGLAAALASRGMSDAEAREYEARLRQGRYLLAVEVGDRAPAARAALDAAGADRIAVER
jgi:uncharacterized membrane protein